MNFGISQAAHLFVGNAAPVTCYNGIGAFETVRQIHGDHVELRGRSALQEQDLIMRRNVQQLAQVMFGVVQNA